MDAADRDDWRRSAGTSILINGLVLVMAAVAVFALLRRERET